MKSRNPLTLVLILCVFSACGGSSDGSVNENREVANTPDPCSMELNVVGPVDGDIPLGTMDAVFLDFDISISCQTSTLSLLSILIDSDTAPPFCTDSCNSEQDWNLRNPRLVTESGEITSASTRNLVQTYGKKTKVEFSFDTSPINLTSPINNFRFLLDVSNIEVVDDSLIGRRFRASFGDVETTAIVDIDPVNLSFIGGYQTIIDP